MFFKRIIRKLLPKRLHWWLLGLFILTRKSIASDLSFAQSYIKGLNSAGKNVVIENSSITINVNLGNNCSIFESSLSGNVKIGRFSTINKSTLIGETGLTIGSFCSIAPGCYISDVLHDHKRLTSYFIHKNLINMDNSKKFDKTSKGACSIGNDVWIGAQSVIVSGVKIGDGAVIGANSTVTSDIPPFAIAVGSPARVVKYRFPPDIIARINKLAWWDWPEEKIKDNKEIFSDSVDINIFQNYIAK